MPLSTRLAAFLLSRTFLFKHSGCRSEMLSFRKGASSLRSNHLRACPPTGGLLNPCLAKGCGVTGVWQVTDADIGRPATLLLGSKRRALAEFEEECTFINRTAHGVFTSGANRSEVDSYRQTAALVGSAASCLVFCSRVSAGLSTGNFPSGRKTGTSGRG